MGLSFGHILVVLILVLILFGAGKFAKGMGELGKGIRNLKDGLKSDEDAKIEKKEEMKDVTPPKE